MSFVDKLKFWKHEEAPEESKYEAQPLPEQQMPSGMDSMGMPRQMPGLTEPPFEAQTSSPFAQPPQSFPQTPQAFQQSAMTSDQQLQLISSKLDTIKAQLETVLQRLERLERKDESPYQQRWRTNT